jgi:hypothetical protein
MPLIKISFTNFSIYLFYFLLYNTTPTPPPSFPSFVISIFSLSLHLFIHAQIVVIFRDGGGEIMNKKAKKTFGKETFFFHSNFHKFTSYK